MIWSGYNQMAGFTPIDSSIVIDMWLGNNAKEEIKAGHQVIQSTDGWLYVVPGAPYYGVNNKFLYETWTPNNFGKNQVVEPGQSQLLGGKLHIWNDLGPMGFTYHETAEEIGVAMPVVSEKLWGTKMSATFDDFTQRVYGLKKIPQVDDTRVLENLKSSDPVVDVDFEKNNLTDAINKQLIKPLTNNSTHHVLTLSENDFVQLNLKADELEQPWTLSFDVKKRNDPDTTSVLFESPYGSIFMNFKDKKTGKSGFGIARTVGYKEYAGNDNDTYYHVFDTIISVNEWANITLTGGYRTTTLYINGVEIETLKKQFVCPLKTIGSNSGHLSANVLLSNLKVFSRILNKEEVKIFFEKSSLALKNDKIQQCFLLPASSRTASFSLRIIRTWSLIANDRKSRSVKLTLAPEWDILYPPLPLGMYAVTSSVV